MLHNPLLIINKLPPINPGGMHSQIRDRKNISCVIKYTNRVVEKTV